MTVRTWQGALLQPVDAASLNVFRAGFGLIVAAESARFLIHGWIEELYLTPDFHFSYPGFGWVIPWPGTGLYWHLGVLCALGLMIAFGLLTRIAAAAFFVGFGYVFLVDQGAYLNQYYLVLIFAFILAVVPSGRGYSVDTLLHAADAPTQVPHWSVLLLRIQMEVVLLHAGLVKLNEDWLRGEPISTWFADRGHWPLIGGWLSDPVVGWAAAYGITALHLVGAPLLLWRRTRLPVFVIYLVFHLASATIFTIGLFSWITLLGTLMFFDPNWPRALWRRLGGHVAPKAVTAPIEPVRPLVFVGLGLFLAVQILFPARHWLYPGDVAWTAEGRSFAWRMKLHQREGQAHFIVRDPDSGRVWRVAPVDYLSSRAASMLPGEPDQILQFAHYLQARWKAEYNLADVQVYADVKLSLNGRPPQPLVDSTLDLAREPRHLGHYRWILPQTQTANPKAQQPQPI